MFGLNKTMKIDKADAPDHYKSIKREMDADFRLQDMSSKTATAQ